MKTYTKKCKVCGTVFEGTGANSQRCPKCFMYNCDNCGKRFSLERYRTSKGYINKRFWTLRHFCSNKCRNQFQSNLLGNQKGINNRNWRGGRIKQADGYIKIHQPNHPYADDKGYVLEHRVIMENHLKRFLSNLEEVHHKNKIKGDNRIENLEIVPRKNHLGKIVCPHCLKEFSIK